MSWTNDRNFKNLILDYPRQSLEFFAAEEAGEMTPDVRITPARQEQLKDRLGDHFHELDTPLLTERPGGKRKAVLFVVEEETEPEKFSVHRTGRDDTAGRCQHPFHNEERTFENYQ